MSSCRSFTCECDDRRCRERIYLTVGEYRAAARQGRVVALEHAPRGVRGVRYKPIYAIIPDEAVKACV